MISKKEINYKAKKLLVTFFICIFAILISSMTFLSVPLFNKEPVAQAYNGGNGTAGSPYLISSQADLQSLRTDTINGQTLGQYYKQTNDITLTESNWTPIGPSTSGWSNHNVAGTPFRGTYDGGFFRIHNLKTTSSSYGAANGADNAGLFNVNFGTIKNVIIASGTSTGQRYTGSIAAVNMGTIDSCLNEGVSITGHGETGGIVGYNKGTITKTTNKGSVQSNKKNQVTTDGSHAGGIVGMNQAGIINQSMNLGNVTATGGHIGGIAGWLYQGDRIEDVLVKANISSPSDRAGTIVGNKVGSHINRSLFLGSLNSGHGQNTNSAINMGDAGNINHFYSGSAQTTLPNGFGADVWSKGISGFNDGNIFPKNNVIAQIHNFYDGFSGSGTSSDPFIINDVNTLKALKDKVANGVTTVNKYFKQTANIDLNNEEWTPIGTISAYNNNGVSGASFDGIYDGSNHFIMNLKIDYDRMGNGLFGFAGSGSVLKNIILYGGNVKSYKAPTGALVGASYGTIEGCINLGVNIDTNSVAGGLVGYTNGSITKSYNFGNISKTRSSVTATSPGQGSANNVQVGGIVGFANAKIEECGNYGNVTSSNAGHLGGIAGAYYGGIMVNCYNLGDIVNNGGDRSGGFTTNNNGTIHYCYNAGKITGPYANNFVSMGNEATHSSNFTSPPSNKPADFGSDWALMPGYNNGYPMRSNGVFDPATIGLSGDIVVVDSYADMVLLAINLISGVNNYYGKTIQLSKDIDLGNNNWMPIGTMNYSGTASSSGSVTGNAFEGTFDGNGKKINNLKIDVSGKSGNGLFAYIGANGTIKNLEINGHIKGSNNSRINGGFAGWNEGKIINSINRVTIESNGTAGGFAGFSAGSIIDCINYANVKFIGSTGNGIILPSQEYNVIALGGISGVNNGLISKCINSKGTISSGGGVHVGGISGWMVGNKAEINNSINSFDVTSLDRAGGIVGTTNKVNANSIINCINTGVITTNSIDKNYIVNNAIGNYPVKNCFTNSNRGSIITEVTLLATNNESWFNGEVAWKLNTSGGGSTNSGIWTNNTRSIPSFATNRNATYKLTTTITGKGTSPFGMYYNGGAYLYGTFLNEKGYSFKSYVFNGSTFLSVTLNQTMPQNDVILTVIFEANTYTVLYHSNDSNNSTVTTYVKYDTTFNFKPSDTFAYPGFTFKEWNTSASGDGVSYQAGQSAINLEYLEKVLHIYAIRELDSLSVSTPSGITVDYNGTINKLDLGFEHGAKDSAVYTWYKNGAKYEGSDTYGVSLKDVVDSGEYYCEITISLEGQTKSVTSGKFTVVINKINYNMSGISFDYQEFVYNGQAQQAKLNGNLPIGFDGISLVVVYDGSATNVRDGVQTVTATFSTTSGNYFTPTQMTTTMKIIPAEYDMLGVFFVDKEVVYNNLSQSIEINGNLPKGHDGITVTVRYEGSATNVSDTTIKAIFSTASANYNAPLAKEAILSIIPADYDMTGVSFNDAEFDYNGKPQNQTIVGVLPIGLDGIGVTVSYQGAVTNATTGETVTALFSTESKNYNVPNALTATVVINKIDYNMANITFTNASLKYNGEKQHLSISGSLPLGLDGIYLTVRYEGGATNIDEGAQQVTAIFETTSNNYFIPQSMVAFVSIIVADYDMSTVSFSDKTYVYDGQKHSIEILENQLPTGKDGIKITAVVEGGATNVLEGKQLVTATFYTTSTNYKAPAPMQAYVTITKATYNMSGITLVSTIEYDYNGQSQRPSIEGVLPIGADNIPVTVRYEGAEINASDSYFTVKAIFETYSDNYFVPEAKTSLMKINKIRYDISNITFDDISLVYNGQPQRPSIIGELPVGLDGLSLKVSYQGSATNVPQSGTTVTAIFSTDSINYSIPDSKIATITILKADYVIDGIEFNNSSLVYNGEAQHHTIIGSLPVGYDNIPLTVRYEGSATNVTDGIVNIKAIFETLSQNYNIPTALSSDFYIEKANYDMSNIRMIDQSYVFDNKDHGLTIIGSLPIGKDLIRISVSYQGTAKFVTDGKQKVVATFNTMSTNYNIPQPLEGYVTIIKADYDMSNLSFEDLEISYTGKPHYPKMNGNLPIGLDGLAVSVNYLGSATNVSEGKVNVVAKFGTESPNYNIPNDMIASVKVLPALVNVTPQSFTKNYGEDDTTISETIQTLINGETIIITYNRALGEDVNYYDLLTISTNDTNYNVEFVTDSNIDKFQILKIDYNLSGISLNDQTLVYNGKEQSLEIKGDLPIGLDGIQVGVVYSHTLKDSGEVDVTVSFTTTSNNYNIPSQELSAKLTINPIVLSFSKYQTYIGIIGETSTIDLVQGEHFIVNNVLPNDSIGLEYTATFEDESAKFTSIIISFTSSGNKNYTFPTLDYQFVIDAQIARDILVEFVSQDYIFDNQRHTPTVKVTLGSRILNTYSVIYYNENNINIGQSAPNNAGVYRMEVKATHTHAQTVVENFSFTIERTEAVFIPNSTNKLTQTYGDFSKLSASFVGKYGDMKTDGVITYNFEGIPTVGKNFATATFHGDKNYLPMTGKIEFTVERRDLFVNINYDYFNYNGKSYQATYSINNAISIDSNIVTVYVGDRLTQTDVGIYPIEIILNNSNYNVVKSGASVLNIIKAPLTVGIVAPDKMILDTDTVVFDLYFSGFMQGDGVSDLKEMPRIQQAQFKAGVHTVLPIGGESNNYYFIYKPQTITVNYNNINFEGANESNLVLKGIYDHDVKVEANEVNGSSLINGFYNNILCAYQIKLENVNDKDLDIVINNNKIKYSMFTSVYFVDENGNKTKLSAASFNNGMLELSTKSGDGYIVVVDNYSLIYILIAAIIVLVLIVIKLVADKKRFVKYVESKNFWMRED